MTSMVWTRASSALAILALMGSLLKTDPAKLTI